MCKCVNYYFHTKSHMPYFNNSLITANKHEGTYRFGTKIYLSNGRKFFEGILRGPFFKWCYCCSDPIN
jgi:hypothetical protein